MEFCIVKVKHMEKFLKKFAHVKNRYFLFNTYFTSVYPTAMWLQCNRKTSIFIRFWQTVALMLFDCLGTSFDKTYPLQQEMKAIKLTNISVNFSS